MSKAKLTIQFKPDLELKLKRLRIKGKFIKELKMYLNQKLVFVVPEIVRLHKNPGIDVDKKTHRTIDSAIHLNGKKHWRQFIQCAFNWEFTEDGYTYWNEIAKK